MNLGATIKVMGGLLPQQLLERVAAGDPALPGTKPADYHQDSSTELNQTINRAWAALTGRWASFKAAQAALPEGDRATALTRDRWLLPLFQELGYGRLPVERTAIIADDRPFAISHRWGHVPIHLLGAGLSLDRRIPGERGAAASPPHGLVQDLLNHAAGHQWAFLSNGLELRILRDHKSLTRQAYISFDLEAIFDGEQFSAFRLLWLLCHQSRVEGEDARTCWLERWVGLAQDEGVRALERLRDGVETALNALGAGFLRHRANETLKARLASGQLSTQDYYRQLLRLVYRLIFLFVAEDRDLLLVPDAPEVAKDRYRRLYATKRLRALATRRRGGPHEDAWAALALVMRQLDRGNPDLALPALGSFLWGAQDQDGRRVSRAVPDLDGARIANEDLYAALAALCVVRDGAVRRPVDWSGVQSDELGSVYEALMERVPRVNVAAASFELVEAGGNERKTTGSYYTPTPLVEAVLDVSLERALDEAQRRPDPERAILELAVVDPACGSGHFLVAAARRIAHRLARVRCGGIEPSPPEVQHALRDVVGRCIYGVDLNPMAVELCKVSLWMEAIEPGRPLSFLDGHIRRGHALLGTTPELMAKGIPDEAWDPIEGDDKEVARRLKRENSSWRQTRLFGQETASGTADLAALSRAVEAASDNTLDAVEAKERAWQTFEANEKVRSTTQLADVWCAAFVWPKVPGEAEAAAPTRRLWEEIRAAPDRLPDTTRRITDELDQHYAFFHWPIAFPQVFAKGGFDVVLGNPPWDTLSPDAKEFFSRWDGAIRQQDREQQQATIDRLTSDPLVARLWAENRRTLFGWVHFIKQSGRFLMFAEGNLGKGDFNVYRMFVETALTHIRPKGFAAQVVPDGLYGGANTSAIRQKMLEAYSLDPLLGFENAAGVWFPQVHRSQKLCIYAARRIQEETRTIRARFGLRTHQDLSEALAGDLLRIPVEMIREFSPDALAIMEFSSQLDIDIAAKMYARWPKFGDESAGPPHRKYMAEIHMGNDRELFSEEPDGLPLYEGRMVTHYDHRAKGYRGGRGRSADWEEYPFGHPGKSIRPQWYIPRKNVPEKTEERLARYRVAFCDVTGATNERTFMSALLPRQTLAGHSLPTIQFEPEFEWAYLLWLAAGNAFTIDFLARFKASNHMTYGIVDSLPFPRLPIDHPVVAPLARNVLRLTCTGSEMIPFWNAMAHHGWVAMVDENGPAPGILDEDDRLSVIAEIEVIVARDLYGLNLDEMRHILSTFPIVARRQESLYGEYRTRRLVEDFWVSLPPHGARSSLDLGQPNNLLRDVLTRIDQSRALPYAKDYRDHADVRVRDAFLQLLVGQAVDLHIWPGQPVRLRPTLKGLRALDFADVERIVRTARSLLPALQRRYRLVEGRDIPARDLAKEVGEDPRWVAVVLALLDSIEVSADRGPEGVAEKVRLSSRVLDLDPATWPLPAPPSPTESTNKGPGQVVAEERLKLASIIADRLQRGGSCALVGPRRAGKTFISKLIVEQLANRQVISLNLRADALMASDEIWSSPDHLALAIDRSLESDPFPASALRRRWLASPKSERPIIIMDEIAGLARVDITTQPSTLGWLRAVGQDVAGILYIGSRSDWERVMAVARGEPGSSFGNDVEFFTVEPLSETSARAFLERGGLSEAEVERALQVGGRWPFTLRLVVDALSGGHSATLDDEALQHSILTNWNEAFRDMWHDLTVDARRGLKRVIGEQLPARDWPSKVRIAAENEGVIDRNGVPVIAVNNPLLCEWVKRRTPEETE